jgi:hypothetical protein
MAKYDQTITPPRWWLDRFEKIADADDLSSAKLAERAVMDSPGGTWDKTALPIDHRRTSPPWGHVADHTPRS